MPDPTDIAKLYAPAPQINAALKSILTDGGLAVYTPGTAPALQKERGRIEVTTQVRQEKQSYHVFSDGSKRNASFNGQIEFSIITPVQSSDPTQLLDQYQAVLAWLMSNIVTTLNGNDANGDAYLPYHEIQRITGDAYAQSYPYQDGYLISKPIYTLDFGIDHGAWTEVGLTAT